MCKELARRGFNLVIVSRNIGKMREAERKVKEKSPACQVRLV
jgi:short-subunit dehydrogenase